MDTTVETAQLLSEDEKMCLQIIVETGEDGMILSELARASCLREKRAVWRWVSGLMEDAMDKDFDPNLLKNTYEKMQKKQEKEDAIGIGDNNRSQLNVNDFYTGNNREQVTNGFYGKVRKRRRVFGLVECLMRVLDTTEDGMMVREIGQKRTNQEKNILWHRISERVSEEMGQQFTQNYIRKLYNKIHHTRNKNEMKKYIAENHPEMMRIMETNNEGKSEFGRDSNGELFGGVGAGVLGESSFPNDTLDVDLVKELSSEINGDERLSKEEKEKWISQLQANLCHKKCRIGDSLETRYNNYYMSSKDSYRDTIGDWAEIVSDTKARCKWCARTIDVSKGGIKAFRLHSKRVYHRRKADSANGRDGGGGEEAGDDVLASGDDDEGGGDVVAADEEERENKEAGNGENILRSEDKAEHREKTENKVDSPLDPVLRKLYMNREDGYKDLIGDWAERLSETHARCKWCDFIFTVRQGCLSKLRRHSRTLKHKRVADVMKGREFCAEDEVSGAETDGVSDAASDGDDEDYKQSSNKSFTKITRSKRKRKHEDSSSVHLQTKRLTDKEAGGRAALWRSSDGYTNTIGDWAVKMTDSLVMCRWCKYKLQINEGEGAAKYKQHAKSLIHRLVADKVNQGGLSSTEELDDRDGGDVDGEDDNDHSPRSTPLRTSIAKEALSYERKKKGFTEHAGTGELGHSSEASDHYFRELLRLQKKKFEREARLQEMQIEKETRIKNLQIELLELDKALKKKKLLQINHELSQVGLACDEVRCGGGTEVQSLVKVEEHIICDD